MRWPAHLPVLQASCAGGPGRAQPSKVRVMVPAARQDMATRPAAHTLSTQVLQGSLDDTGGSTTASTGAAGQQKGRERQAGRQAGCKCVLIALANPGCVLSAGSGTHWAERAGASRHVLLRGVCHTGTGIASAAAISNPLSGILEDSRPGVAACGNSQHELLPLWHYIP